MSVIQCAQYRQTGRAILAAIMLALAWTQQSQAVPWTKTSTMKVLPGNDGWKVHCDPLSSQSISDGILHLVDDNNPSNECIQYWNFVTAPGGFTIEMRVRMDPSSVGHSNGFNYDAGSSDAAIDLYNGKIVDHWSGITLWTGDLTDELHCVRAVFEPSNGTGTLWVDAQLAGIFPLRATAPGQQFIYWGTGNFNSTGDMYVDYIRYSVDGAFPPDPGELCGCGDGVISQPEECDDGNTTGGDGCDSTCEVEPGFFCQGEPSVCFPEGIPAVSQWGVAVMVLLMLTAGTFVLRRRRIASTF